MRQSFTWFGLLSLLLGCTVPPEVGSVAGRQLAQAHQEGQRTGVCEVHNIAMHKKAVPLRWGEAVPPGPGSPSYHYRMQHFPNYIEVIEGGCCKVAGRTSQMTLICARCKEEAMEWGQGKK